MRKREFRMETIQIRLATNIKERLHDLAKHEGRTDSEIIREAIVKLLRERGFLGIPEHKEK